MQDGRDLYDQLILNKHHLSFNKQIQRMMYYMVRSIFAFVLLFDICLKGLESTIVWNTNAVSGNQSIGIPSDHIEFGYDGDKNEKYEKVAASMKKYTFDEKCDKGLELGIGFQVYTPYSQFGYNKDYSEVIVSGIFPHVMKELMKFCCPKSIFSYGKLMTSLLEVEQHFGADMEVDMAFPVHGQDGPKSKQFKDYPFVPIVTAPRIVLLVPEQLFEDLNTRTKVLMTTIFNAWPMLIFIIVSACLAGLTVWMLDRNKNSGEFPPTFFAGAWEGVWWAFVTMTTVGYGDRSPKSLFARFFCIMWILLGIILISLFTGLVSAALSASSTPVFNIPGSKIGAVRGSVEYQVGVGLNAEMYSYDNHHTMLSDLMTNKILHAAMIDNYILSASTEVLKKSRLRMEREVEHPVTYGIVMVHNSSKTEKCFRKYLRHFPQELFEIIHDKLVPVKNPTDEIRLEVAAAEKLFYEEDVFKTIVYTESGIMIMALLMGCIWEVLVRNKNSAAYQLVAKFRKGGPKFVDRLDFEDKGQVSKLMPPEEIQALVSEYDDYHTKWISKIKTIYRRGSRMGEV